LGKELDTILWSTGVSPDGKLAAVAGLKPVLPFLAAPPFQRQFMDFSRGVIYDTATGKLRCRFEAPNSHDTRIGAFSPDGTILATAASRWQVDLYDSRTGKHMRALEWEREPGEMRYSGGFTFIDVAFMPDGKQLLASSHATGVIRLFDVQSGKLLRQFRTLPTGIASMVLSADGQRLAVLEAASEPGNFLSDSPGSKIRILDSHTGRQVAEILGKGFHQNMVFANDGKTLFAGKDEKGTCVWDTSSGARVGSVPFPNAILALRVFEWVIFGLHDARNRMIYWRNCSFPSGEFLSCFCDGQIQKAL
jgi:WD40 repeat protein